MSETKKPETLRDGAVKAAIWENEGDKGKFHSVTFSRTYKDQEGNYKDSNRFSGTDLLKVSQLAGQAYEKIGQKRDKSYADQQRENAKTKQENRKEHQR